MSHSETDVPLASSGDSDNRRLDLLCDQFERLWRAGETPRLEEYLDQFESAKRRPAFRELLLVELEIRRNSGDDPKLEEYFARFPSERETVAQVFESIDHQRAATVDHSTRRSGSGGLRVRCPHCGNPIDLTPDASLESIDCPSCGSNFSLAGENQTTRDADSITQLGHFQLIERLGMGAFGAVWKARDTQLDRTVAVKVPRKGQLGADEIEKFFREARSAAQLRHPNIVPVFEVGRDGDSVFIVSEFIRGVPLSEMLADARLPFAEAAGLLKTIAEALHHAHEAGVVHRDLKPQNVMIDDEGKPHLMDFGLAKREAGEVTMTLDGVVLGTPAYMSPEQAAGMSHKVDRTTDIYSLGVMLFQMLTGELPFRGTPRMLIHKVINDEAPSPRKLDNRVPRDLETICLKCLEKDPKRRFPSARSVALEIGRFLSGEPLKARPVSSLERGWRWCKRNRAVASLAAAATLLLVAVATVATVGYVQTSRALRAKAEAAATSAEVSKFLTNLFRSSDPVGWSAESPLVFEQRDPTELNLTARELLDRGARRIETELKDQPNVQLTLMETIGGVYLAVGAYDDAIKTLQAARERRLAEDPVDRMKLTATTDRLAHALYFGGRYDDAERLFRQTLHNRIELLGKQSFEVANTMQGLGLLLSTTEKFEEAEALLKETIAIRKSVMGERHESVAVGMAVLATVYLSDGRDDLAGETVAEAMAVYWATNPDDSVDAGKAMLKYQEGAAAMIASDMEKAEPLLRESVQRMSEALGPRHPIVAWGIHDHAQVLEQLGRYEEAIVEFERAIRIADRTVSKRHPKLIQARMSLAALHFNVGDAATAETMLTDVTAIAAEAFGEQSPKYAAILRNKVPLLRDTGRIDESIEAGREALDILLAVGDSQGETAWDIRCELARSLRRADRHQDVIELMEQLLAEQMTSPIRSPNRADRNSAPEVRRPGVEIPLIAYELLGNAYRNVDDLDRAEAAFQEGRTVALAKVQLKNAWAARYGMLLGEIDLARRRWKQADDELNAAYRAIRDVHGEDDEWTEDAAKALAELASAKKDREVADQTIRRDQSPVSSPAIVEEAR